MAASSGPSGGARSKNTPAIGVDTNSTFSNNKSRELNMDNNEVGNRVDSEKEKSWASTVESNKVDHDYVLTVSFRKNYAVSNTNLTTSQKGRLAFKRLNIPRGKLLAFDDTSRNCVRLTISGSVPGHTLNLTQSFEAKPGLWMG